jgi:septum site-determining protein MinC
MKPKITAFEIKNLDLPLISFVVKSPDLTLLKNELSQKLADMPDFFSGEPAVIDLTALHDEDLPELDLAGIKALLGTYHLQPWAIKSHQQQFIEMGQQLGLPEISAFLPSTTHSKKEAQKHFNAAELEASRAPHPQNEKIIDIKELVQEVPAEKSPTMIITKPLRSGQHIYARGGDLVILAMVNAGAEVMADGHIHVYAPLRGKAIAGARGDATARIFTSCLEAELLSIAGIYRTSDNALPKDVQGQSAQIFLEEDKLVMRKLD